MDTCMRLIEFMHMHAQAKGNVHVLLLNIGRISWMHINWCDIDRVKLWDYVQLHGCIELHMCVVVHASNVEVHTCHVCDTCIKHLHPTSVCVCVCVCVCVFVVYIARTESTAAQQQQQQQQQQQEDHEAVLPSRESRSMYLQSPRQGTHMWKGQSFFKIILWICNRFDI